MGFYQNPGRCQGVLVCEPLSLRLILFQIKTYFSSELLSWGGNGGKVLEVLKWGLLRTPLAHFLLVSDGRE